MVTIDGITLDAALTEKTDVQVDLTDHPVEVGADPVDHARIRPKMYVVEGMFSDTSVDAEEFLARGGVSHPSDTHGYSTTQRDAIYQLALDRRAVTVQSESKKLKNMVLVSISEPRNSEISQAVQFTLTFKEVRFVTNQTVRFQQTNTPTSVPNKPTGKVSQAKKSPTTMDSSIAVDLTDTSGLTSSLPAATAGGSTLAPPGG